ncbi:MULTISPECIES: hypothetical protein [unclassified Rhizobium]|uniref:hypothetical protein n=1 Tax=unclassified Rhizobium TaxID=2613769 RepID=UPI000715676C|nr:MULTISPECIES: hypothetical protein [unclassified Rhizobium]KQS88101.1 hypothetical protein ASG42_16390 [Rhizobium sp. Leaf391]KQT00598.1 hypothetical protein ASG50_19375 [Rhizobium sp. Leaf386]KQU09070.1 hypothetical protein ASG68_20250 [Rhizobium sp. Leaf453]
MKKSHAAEDDLHSILDRKLTALFREMEDADWRADDIASAIDDIVKRRWLNQAQSLQGVRDVMSKNFVSDGNEG